MNCINCGSPDLDRLTLREIWSAIWEDKAEGCFFSCNVLLDLGTLVALLPLMFLLWFSTTECGQCGGVNLSFFGIWRKYLPPK